MGLNNPLRGEVRPPMAPSCTWRLMEKTASSAVNGEPSWKVTPRRSRISQTVSLTGRMDSANSLTISICGFRVTKPS